MKKSHIGARIPVPVKEALQEKAKAAGLSMSEFLEQRFTDLLNEEEAGHGLTREEIEQLIDTRIAGMIDARLSVIPEAPVGEELPAADPETVLVPADEEEIILEVEVPEEEEVLPLENEDWLQTLLSPLLAEELNCAIVSSWEELEEPDGETPGSVVFLEALAKRLQQRANEPSKYNCSDAYADILPEHLVPLLDHIIRDAAAEFTDHTDRQLFLFLVADLSRDQARKLYVEGRTFRFTFDRTQWSHLDRMLESINAQQPSDEQFDSLQSWIYFQLGRQLKESAGEKFLGGYRNPSMAQLGKEFQMMASDV